MLKGLAGAGKTEAAVEYFRKHIELPFRIWFNAESIMALNREYIEFSKYIGLLKLNSIISDSEDNLGIVERVKSYLSEINALVIYDNAESYELIRPYIPPSNCKIVVTALSHQHWPSNAVVEVDVMDATESRQLAKKILEETCDETSIDQLVAEVGSLPLAIDQACAYILSSGINITNYLRIFCNEKSRLVALEHTTVEARHRSVYTTFTAILNKLADIPDASVLLFYCAYLNMRDIPKSLLQFYYGVPISSAAAEASFNRAIEVLIKYHMLKKQGSEIDVTGVSYSIHPLVQVMAQQILPVKQQNEILLNLIGTMDKYLADKLSRSSLRNYPLCQLLVIHFDKLGSYCHKAFIESEPDAILLQALIKFHQAMATLYHFLEDKFKVKLHLDAIKAVLPMLYGVRSIEYADQLCQFVNDYFRLYDVAIDNSLLDEALTIYRDSLYGSLGLANKLYQLISLYVVGYKVIASRLTKELITIYESSFRDQPLKLADSLLDKVFEAYIMLQDDNGQKHVVERAFEIYQAHATPGTLEYADKMSELICRAAQLIDPVKAAIVLKEIIVIHTGSFFLADQPRRLARLMHGYYMSYLALKDYLQAEACLDMSLALYREALTETSKLALVEKINKLANDYEALSSCCNEERKLYLRNRARELIDEAFQIQTNYLDEVGPDVLISQIKTNIASQYFRTADKKLHAAETFYRRQYKENYIELADKLYVVIFLYEKLSDNPKVEVLFLELLGLYQRSVLPFSPEIFERLTKLVSLAIKLGRWQEAKMLADQAFKMLQASDYTCDGEKVLSLAVIYNVLAESKQVIEVIGEPTRLTFSFPERFGNLYLELAIAHSKLGQLIQARLALNQALECPVNSFFSRKLKTYLARIELLEDGGMSYAEAIPLFIQALDPFKNLSPAYITDDIYLLRIALADAYIHTEQIEEGIKELNRITKGLNAPRNMLHSCSLNIMGIAMNVLGNAKRLVGKYDEAQTDLLNALKIKQDFFGKDHSETTDVQKSLAMLYRDRERGLSASASSVADRVNPCAIGLHDYTARAGAGVGVSAGAEQFSYSP
ncbi:MAG: tetratricopeptide repeat protein [Gammaproteobacteria bacterium]|nr:tetratricopeptide repeat protein [Gammaproteobacteria bacterium]